MSETTGILMMMNNYFHDVATGLLVASGVAMLMIARGLGESRHPDATGLFLRIYRGMTRLAVFSLAWIVLGGIPRTIFYRDLEWANAAGRNQVPALIVKHVLAFILVGAGACVWIRLRGIAAKCRTGSDATNRQAPSA